MKLKTVRRIIYGLLSVVILFCCLMVIHPLWGIGGLVSFAALAIFNLSCYRCPHCKGHLGREIGKYCQHCGEKLDQD